MVLDLGCGRRADAQTLDDHFSDHRAILLDIHLKTAGAVEVAEMKARLDG
ncbi:hypothetical protein [Bradyrhizobium sp. 162]|nr:hypothetical protein [Bradyrhizobium sp. 162]MCK1635424.1 hypothetical protein [Bradyrhizobium sp. 162]